MTRIRSLLAVVLTLGLVGALSSLAAEPSPTPAGERVAPERMELKVLRVFSAQDGTAIFRAYLVNWKGQEVVVSDTLAKTNYREGDTIGVLVMNHPFPQNREPHRLLGFSILPPR